MNALSAWMFALIVIAAQMTGWTCGRFIRMRLPAEHLTSTTRDAVVLAVGMVATLSALVLGLMISTAKTSFDADRASVVDIAGNILMMDRALAQYGDETRPAREVLSELTRLAIEEVRAEAPSQPQVAPGPPLPHLTSLQTLILELSPADNGQRWLQTRALTLSADLERARVLMAERSDGSIPLAFLIVLVAWLAMLYLALAIFAPANATASGAALGGSLAFAAAIFLILELDRPFHGFVRVSAESLVGTMELLGR